METLSKRVLLLIWPPLQNDKVSKTDFSKSHRLLDAIKSTQIKYGGATMLSEDKIATEIIYTTATIFSKNYLNIICTQVA